LKKTVEQGCQVHIIVGNHDFWIGEYFTQELGISVHYKPIAALLNKQKFLLIHGDGILKNDRGYRMLKKLLRSPVTIRLFRIIHPDLVYKIARKVSKFSRKYSMKKIGGENTETTRKELIQFAEEQFQQGIQNVIMGHYHLPIIYQSGEQVFINLGDWMQYFSYAIFDGRNLSLCYWPRSA
jgi:UDP-2,3-diacylglucosamine hydrolase